MLHLKDQVADMFYNWSNGLFPLEELLFYQDMYLIGEAGPSVKENKYVRDTEPQL